MIAKIKYRYNEISFIQYIILTGVVSIYGIFANIFIDDLLIRWGGCLVVFIVLVLYYKEDIEEVLRKIKK